MIKPLFFLLAILTYSCKSTQFNTIPTKILIETSQELMDNNQKVVAHIFTARQKNTDNQFEELNPYEEKEFDSVLALINKHDKDKEENIKTIKTYNQVFNVLTNFNNTLKMFVSDSVDKNTSNKASELFKNLSCGINDINGTKLGNLTLTDSLISSTNNTLINFTQYKIARLRKKYLTEFLSKGQYDFNAICDFLAGANSSILQSLIATQQAEDLKPFKRNFSLLRSKTDYNSIDGKKIIDEYIDTKQHWQDDSLITQKSSTGYGILKKCYADLIQSLHQKIASQELLNHLKELYFNLNDIKNGIKYSTHDSTFIAQ